MAKSVNKGNINLSDSPEDIRRKLAQAVTDPARVRLRDPGEPKRCPVYTIHTCYTPQDVLAELAQGCRSASIGCLKCKRILADEIIADLEPVQARQQELLNHPQEVYDILAQGAAAARPLAQQTLREVRQKMGIA